MRILIHIKILIIHLKNYQSSSFNIVLYLQKLKIQSNCSDVSNRTTSKQKQSEIDILSFLLLSQHHCKSSYLLSTAFYFHQKSLPVTIIHIIYTQVLFLLLPFCFGNKKAYFHVKKSLNGPFSENFPLYVIQYFLKSTLGLIR